MIKKKKKNDWLEEYSNCIVQLIFINLKNIILFDYKK